MFHSSSFSHYCTRFGLSYTTFSLSNLSIAEVNPHGPSIRLDVSVTVKNTGQATGSEVVQLYVSLPDIGLSTPARQLRAFAKVHDLWPGQMKQVTLTLDKYAISFWDTGKRSWHAKAGRYGVLLGRSSADIVLQGSFILQNGFTWCGL